jgi:hypothetical protein
MLPAGDALQPRATCTTCAGGFIPARGVHICARFRRIAAPSARSPCLARTAGFAGRARGWAPPRSLSEIFTAAGRVGRRWVHEPARAAPALFAGAERAPCEGSEPAVGRYLGFGAVGGLAAATLAARAFCSGSNPVGGAGGGVNV